MSQQAKMKTMKEISIDFMVEENIRREKIAIQAMKIVASKYQPTDAKAIARDSYKIAEAMIEESRNYL